MDGKGDVESKIQDLIRTVESMSEAQLNEFLCESIRHIRTFSKSRSPKIEGFRSIQERSQSALPYQDQLLRS